jgi:hypothetical protein
MTENNKELYFCGACEKVNLRWGHCWSCGCDDLTPKLDIQRMYETSKNALEKIEKFQVDDFMQDGRLTREIQEAERRNWE